MEHPVPERRSWKSVSIFFPPGSLINQTECVRQCVPTGKKTLFSRAKCL